jgi:hypothetical protein
MSEESEKRRAKLEERLEEPFIWSRDQMCESIMMLMETQIKILEWIEKMEKGSG